jgi:26S proteasome regulatory subunit T3
MIAAICQEAGMLAVRKNRYVILHKNFEKGYRTNVKKPQTDFDFYIFIKEIEIIRKQFSIFIF